MQSRKFLILAFSIPILVLVGIALNAEYLKRSGVEVTLPIQGYDPRDILRGNFLFYTIDYGVDPCPNKTATTTSTSFVCVSPKGLVTDYVSQNCQIYIKGECMYGTFRAGIEKFYVPEHIAQNLQATISTQPMSVVLAVSKDGRAQVKALSANGNIIVSQ